MGAGSSSSGFSGAMFKSLKDVGSQSDNLASEFDDIKDPANETPIAPSLADKARTQQPAQQVKNQVQTGALQVGGDL
eukprot:NODE_5944_length_352_cov_252.891089_g4800_i0.p1 GENE.NODE_5944_length_352_cov_252.891089_g4800_i0~~NODE_5944_length_352_cov_252.891089_g4800_i0.p1  ORF type:complete len:85 (+),score=41.58 NODE_5944_length_352_cov_252.891089_g4800_i0:25-255(+)